MRSFLLASFTLIYCLSLCIAYRQVPRPTNSPLLPVSRLYSADESISWQEEDEVREELDPIDDLNEYTASYILRHMPLYSFGNSNRMASIYNQAKSYLKDHSKIYEQEIVIDIDKSPLLLLKSSDRDSDDKSDQTAKS